MKVKKALMLGMITLLLCACKEQQNESVSENTESSEAILIETKARENTSEPWYSAYRTILDDWTTIDQYGDFGYLKMYFDTDYQFDSYWLCDVNSDGTPEFFLHSDSMNITALFTYCDSKIHHLMYDVIYGINKRRKRCILYILILFADTKKLVSNSPIRYTMHFPVNI